MLCDVASGSNADRKTAAVSAVGCRLDQWLVCVARAHFPLHICRRHPFSLSAVIFFQRIHRIFIVCVSAVVDEKSSVFLVPTLRGAVCDDGRQGARE